MKIPEIKFVETSLEGVVTKEALAKVKAYAEEKLNMFADAMTIGEYQIVGQRETRLALGLTYRLNGEITPLHYLTNFTNMFYSDKDDIPYTFNKEPDKATDMRWNHNWDDTMTAYNALMHASGEYGAIIIGYCFFGTSKPKEE